MTELSPARRVALDILLDLEESGAYARDGLDGSRALHELAPRDAGLATRLVLGVVATYGCLDELIDTYCDKPGRMNQRIREALRIAVFELVYLGTEPRAAVSQGVELVRTRAKSAAGFANAVLHRVTEDRGSYLDAEDVPVGAERRIVSAARRAGLPEGVVREAVASQGWERVDQLVASELEPAPVAVHLSPLDADAPHELTARVVADGAVRLPGLVSPVSGSGFVHSAALKRAAAVACDANAQLVASAAVMPGTCLEVGAGRGTKTFVMAAQAMRAHIERSVIALEVSGHKTELNRERLARAGLDVGVSFVTGDGCQLTRSLFPVDRAAGRCVRFDSVLVDAPCTGTGTMRRHPEIPWRLTYEDVTVTMPRLQADLLAEAAGRVRPGGHLFYATCSVLRQENEGVVDVFLSSPAGHGFSLERVSNAPFFQRLECSDARGYVREHEDARGLFQTVPSLDGFDGHFCAHLVRCSD